MAGRYWWLKIVALCLALAGVLWTMSTLQDGSYFRNPNSPVQVLMGDPAETSGSPGQKGGDQAAAIPAKVQFENPDQKTGPSK